MPRGYLVTLGNSSLDTGDAISGALITFVTTTNLGAGNWIWSGTFYGTTFTNTSEPGVYYLASDGNVYFVPDYGPVTTISSAQASNPPAYSSGDGIVSGTTGGDLIDTNYTNDPQGEKPDNNANTINAGGGNDTVYAYRGDDTIFGGSGNDTIFAGSGNDSVDGGTGDDTVFGGTGADSIAGQDGNDILNGGDGNDTIDGGIGNDTINGDAGDDSILGGTGNDVIRGDTIAAPGRIAWEWSNMPDPNGGGLAGIDEDDPLTTGTTQTVGGVAITYNYRANPTGTTDGTGGTDTAPIFNGELTNTAGINAGTDIVNPNSSAHFGGDFATSEIELVFGTAVNNVSFNINDIDSTGVFTDRASVFAFNAAGQAIPVTIVFGSQLIASNSDGVAGNETGSATLNFGTSGTDPRATMNVSIAGPVARLVVRYQDTQATGDDGLIEVTDVFFDEPATTSGNDNINAGDGDDVVFGDSGNDTIEGGNGIDSLYGGDGNDIITDSGATDNDYIDGGNGDDTIDAGGGNDQVYGGAGNDLIIGGDDADSLFGDGGNDVIYGGNGNDYVDGGADNDRVFGDAGDDFVMGGLGNDTVYGGTGNDVVSGNDGNDTLFGDEGNDTLFGGDGNDINYGGIGNDGIYGGAGNDSIFGEAGDDIIEGGIGDDYLDGDAGNDSISGDDGNDTIVGDDGNDTLFGGAGNDQIFSSSGNNSAYGGTGNDQIVMGTGNDTIAGGTGNDSMVGGGGNDIFVLENGFGTDNIDGSEDVGDADIDVLDATAVTSNVTVDLSTLSPADNERGTITDGVTTTTFDNIEAIRLGSGNDSVTGSSAADTISLGAGADTINAGAGNDVIDLGNGAADGNPDVIVLTNGFDNDTITSFDAPTLGVGNLFVGIDQLDVTNLFDMGGDPVDTNDVVVTANGAGDAILTFPSGDSITLVGIPAVDADNPFYLNAIGIPLPDGTVSGTSGNDLIDASYTGDPDGDVVDGNDAILPGDTGNDDLIEAGAGNDQIFAGDGNDEIYADTLSVDLNALASTTTGGSITIDVTNQADDTVELWWVDFTGTLVPFQTIPAGGTVLQGTFAGHTWVLRDTDGNILETYSPTTTQSYTYGPNLNDVINAGNGDDTVFAQFGNDTVLAGSGNDIVYGGSGDDYLDGGTGNDTLSGDAGNDTIIGGTGNDIIYGGDGDDFISGGAGADSIVGDAGNDIVNFSDGDYVDGGTGDDTFVLEDLGEATNGGITIIGGTGGESPDDGDPNTLEGDTLKLGSLADLSTLVKVSNGLNVDGNETFSGSVVLDDGTLLTYSEIENIICFTPGTLIATPYGARDIASLKVGDLVVTRDHGLQPIRWIQSRTVPAIDRFAPIRIRPGVVTGLERDILVSPQHRMLFQGYRAELLFGESEVLIAAKHLVDGKDVTQDTGGDVTYIHMMFDEHQIVFAEGCASESFHPGTVGLTAVSDGAREELFALFPDLRSDPNGYGPTARRCLKKHEAELIR